MIDDPPETQPDANENQNTSNDNSNNSNQKPKVVSGGVLNGKATSLPQPPYPATAKAAHASGTVVVLVTIDEDGKVISATAVSGHPLLRPAAVSAARQARFSPTKLSGTPVKVSGTISYNFVAEP
jgi:protein TonB